MSWHSWGPWAVGFCVLKDKGLAWSSYGSFCPASWTQRSPWEVSGPLLLEKQCNSFLLTSPPTELFQAGLFTKAIHSPESFENFSTIIHFAVPSLFSVQQPHCHAEGTSGSCQTKLKRRKVPSSSKHYDYDWCCFFRKMVPTWGSAHIQHLCGVSSFHQKAASLIPWRKGLRRRSWI